MNSHQSCLQAKVKCIKAWIHVFLLKCVVKIFGHILDENNIACINGPIKLDSTAAIVAMLLHCTGLACRYVLRFCVVLKAYYVDNVT